MKKIIAILMCLTMLFSLTACVEGAKGTDGKDGKDGEAGLSAYEIALKSGFQGSESEWLASLVGDTGAQGVGIQSVALTATEGLKKTYTITLTDGRTVDYVVTDGQDGKGIVSVARTERKDNVDTYTITFTDGSETKFTITNGINSDGTGINGQDGNGIASIVKTKTEGLVDTYTITFTEGNKTTFTVTNGKDGKDGEDGEDGSSIASISKTASSGNTDTYTVTLTDGTKTTFTVTNGKDGNDGEDGKDGKDGKDGNGIASIAKTAANGNIDTYTVTMTNGTKATFTVANGQHGKDGKDGEDGRTPEFRVNGEWLQWKYTDETSWKNLYETDGIPAPSGLVSVTYVLNGGTLSGSPTTVYVTAGTSIELPIPTYSGYSFDGWYLNTSDKYSLTSPYRVHESIKIYAKWEAGASVTGTKIYNLNDLAKVANNLGGTYVLMNDIDCEGLALPTIGANSTSPFTGLFDGQGFTISNYIASGGEYVGLFGYNSGTIRNLNVADFKLEQTNTVSFSTLWVGGIAAYNNGVIETCGVTNGNINIVVNANRYGGLLVGENNGTIRNCFAQGIVNINQLSEGKNYAYAAGIAAYNKKAIENCYANVQATAYSYLHGTLSDFYNGYAAMITAYNKGSVTNSLAFGSANGNGMVGDITPKNDKGTIENCYKDETITLTGRSAATFATPMSKTSLSSANFYSISLKWDKTVWSYQNVNLNNNRYPTLIQ